MLKNGAAAAVVSGRDAMMMNHIHPEQSDVTEDRDLDRGGLATMRLRQPWPVLVLPSCVGVDDPLPRESLLDRTSVAELAPSF
jgi:hypothetical protein